MNNDQTQIEFSDDWEQYGPVPDPVESIWPRIVFIAALLLFCIAVAWGTRPAPVIEEPMFRLRVPAQPKVAEPDYWRKHRDQERQL